MHISASTTSRSYMSPAFYCYLWLAERLVRKDRIRLHVTGGALATMNGQGTNQ